MIPKCSPFLGSDNVRFAIRYGHWHIRRYDACKNHLKCSKYRSDNKNSMNQIIIRFSYKSHFDLSTNHKCLRVWLCFRKNVCVRNFISPQHAVSLYDADNWMSWFNCRINRKSNQCVKQTQFMLSLPIRKLFVLSSFSFDFFSIAFFLRLSHSHHFARFFSFHFVYSLLTKIFSLCCVFSRWNGVFSFGFLLCRSAVLLSVLTFMQAKMYASTKVNFHLITSTFLVMDFDWTLNCWLFRLTCARQDGFTWINLQHELKRFVNEECERKRAQKIRSK